MPVQVTELANGLRVATDHMASVATASVGVWVGAGARSEPAEINGVAHFLEHMAFKGTRRRTAAQIAEEIEAVGGYLNAYTARENTAYYAKVLAEDLPLAVDIVSDILLQPTFDQEELARERSVILQEIGQCFDTPDDLVYDRFQEAAFPGQSMGRPVLGTVETVSTIPRDAIRDFMSSRYAGENMVLAAAGAVDHDRLLALAEELFAELPPRAGVHDPADCASYQGGEFRENRDSEQVHLLLGFPGVAYGSDDFYTTAILSTLFGGGMSSRLFQEIREKRGLVYSVHSFGWSFTDSGLFGIYAGTGPDEIEELVPVVCGEIEKLFDGISSDELNRARAQVKAALLMSRESTGARVDQLGQQMLIHGHPLTEAEQIDAVEAVDERAILDTALRIFSGSPTLAAIGPLNRLAPLEDIAARLPKAA